MRFHKACSVCVLNNDCLFQRNDEVESCDEVKEFKKE